ncbi:MAG: hypothetical protein HYY84_10330 [Deltaproteobacteria bacterium]|nr:hypothetical protein [Deltaproteobacteria bacterium]
MKQLILVLLGSFIGIGSACKKEDATTKPADPRAAARPATLPPRAEPAKPAFLAVPKLGVQIEVPADAKVNDGAGDSVMIMSDSQPDCVVMLSKVNPDIADKFEKVVAEIKNAKMGHGPLKAMTKEENQPNGNWKIEWTSTSDITKKDLFGVQHRVVLAGTLYDCARKTNTAAGQACVARACSSLKK